MATRRYSLGASERVEDVVEAAGAATVTKSLEITIDCGVAPYNTAQGRNAALLCLERAADYIMKSNWPPV
jgi:hypothetical protein